MLGAPAARLAGFKPFCTSSRPSRCLGTPQQRRWAQCRASARCQQQVEEGRQQRAALQQQLAAAPGATAALALLLQAGPAQAAAAAAAQHPATANLVLELAALDSKTAGALSAVLKPTLTLATVLMIVRIVMSWYPELDGKQMPWSIAYTPTEPLLSATRKVIQPFNGLDVSPIVWVALLSFVSEILTGPQGILSLIERKGI